MRFANHILAGAALCGIVGFIPTLAQAQTAAAGDTADIVVTGIRGSLQSAQNIKRNSGQIVDSIVAEDIGKLPDVNVAEALQRVSGIQVSRDRGEGAGVAIRGLSQVLVTMNGREAFTGSGRSFNLQDIPAELVSGLDVYKTPSADLIEGGIGGVVDIRTRKPLDKKGLVVSASARARYSDLADKVKPMVSGLISDSWDTGIGEIGVLVSAAYQKRAFRADSNGVGAPSARTDVVAGQTVAAPNGAYMVGIGGVRTRLGLDSMIQWKPTPDLEIYGQASFQSFKSRQDQFGLNVPTNGRTVIPGSVTLFDGTNDVQKISYANVPFTALGVARDTQDKNWQYSWGAKWDTGPAHFSFDGNYSKSVQTLVYSELDLAGVAPRVDQDVSTNIASLHIRNFDLTNIANYNLGPLTRNENYAKGDLWALRADARFDIESNFLKSMHFGVRYADRNLRFEPVRYFQTPATQSASGFASLFIPNPMDDRFDSSTNIDQVFPVADPNQLRSNFDAIRTQIGLTTAPSVSQLGIYTIGEKSTAGYVMAKYGVDAGIRFDGNVGVRVVETQLNVVGNRALYTRQPNGSYVQTGIAPIDQDTSYTSVLPSANIRFLLTDQLQLRLSGSKVLTRPDFGQLAPTLTLVPGQQAGSGGNPDLKPLKADQLDASLEYYFSKTGSVYLAGFYRKVKGFIQSTTTAELIDGINYQITRPSNGKDGKIKGIEVGGQMFFDFLPEPFDGLGVQGNYTYVDSSSPSSVAGLITPLPNLSKHSFNLSGIYEKGPISARIAYNWRDKFFSSLLASGAVLGISPVYRKAYGWLDASINYDVTKNITFTLEGSNLTRAKTDPYYGVQTRPGTYEQDDIQLLAGVRVTF